MIDLPLMIDNGIKTKIPKKVAIVIIVGKNEKFFPPSLKSN